MKLLPTAGSVLAVAIAVAWGTAGGACSSGPSCAERTTDAENAMLAVASQVWDADVSCTSDSDCVVASDDSTCGYGYGCGIVVNEAGVGVLQAAIAKVNATTCADFVADGCRPPPPPPCGGVVTSCVAGACGGTPPK